MKIALILFLIGASLAHAAPQLPVRGLQHQAYQAGPIVEKVLVPVPQTISEYNEKTPDGRYRFGYKLSDGTEKQEEGEPRLVGDVIKVFNRGFYTYIDPEGQLHQRTYYTDETGFHVAGNDVRPT